MLRLYQQDTKSQIYAAWAVGARNVMGVGPCGSGKTRIFTNIMTENKGAAIAIAHRSELVGQMSLALARNNVTHRIVGQASTASICRSIHFAELGRSFVSAHARCVVASVQTLVRHDPDEAWMKEITLVVIDEGHHLLANNIWGTVVKLFPNARVLAMTATPGRADGKGLGRYADGLIDVMIEGPSMRDLIDAGYLTDYRLICPPSDLDMSKVPVTNSGDYSRPKAVQAVRQSHVIGDVVGCYKEYAFGKLGVTFTTDLESAGDIANTYRNAGIAAEVINGKTPALVRAAFMRRFRNREILQLVTVDVLGEGVDVPAIEVVSMARPTESLIVYMQQFGRALRPMEGKEKAIIIDHVGNWVRHGLPDVPRVWSLDRRDSKTRNTPTDVIPLRVCTNCLSAYERIHVKCPFCGARPFFVVRNTPEAIDGDLREMDAHLLARLRGDITTVEAAPKIPYGATPVIIGSIKKNHRERLAALVSLKSNMAIWGGWRTIEGDTICMQQRRFFHQFGIDVLSAQALTRVKAVELEKRIQYVLRSAGITVDPNVNMT
jgi:superfamily II DNA or RNA helicase